MFQYFAIVNSPRSDVQRLRVEGFTISVDGYGAGPNQSLENPIGVGGHTLHEWLVHTRTFGQMHGGGGGSTGIDEDFAARGMANVGAWILAATCLLRAVAHGPTTRGGDGGGE